MRSAVSIAVTLVPVLLAAGFGHQRAAAPASAAVRRAPPGPPEGATLRPLFRKVAPALLVAVAAVTFLSAWDKVRPRNYEIGILRFLGVSKSLVIAVVSAEAALVSAGGAVLGVLIGQGLLALATSIAVADPPYAAGWEWCLDASIVVICAAVSGSAIPCLVSVQQDVLKLLEQDR